MFSIFVGILFGPSALSDFIYFMIELTSSSFVSFKNIPGSSCILHLYEYFFLSMFSAIDTKKLLKESAKILGLVCTLSFIFIGLICFFFLSFL